MKKIIVLILVSFPFLAVFADINDAKNFINQQNYPLAIKALNEELAKDPRNYSAMELLLSSYIKMGNKSAYLSSLNLFLKQDYDPPLNLLKEGSLYAFSLKDYKSLLALTRTINVKDSQDANNLNLMGLSLHYLKDYTMANIAFELSLALEPNNYLVLGNLGLNSLALGYKQKAKMYYQRALTINPNFKKAQLELDKINLAINASKEEPKKSIPNQLVANTTTIVQKPKENISSPVESSTQEKPIVTEEKIDTQNTNQDNTEDNQE